jgi:hypothetical protein
MSGQENFMLSLGLGFVVFRNVYLLAKFCDKCIFMLLPKLNLTFNSGKGWTFTSSSY